MSANAEIIAELRRVLNERDEAREQLDLTKRELGRWVDRETKAVRERDEARADLARSVAAWESAGMQGRTAHDAMLALAKERDEARAEVEHAYREGGALYEAKIAEREAFRCGAEAMREACLGVAERFMDRGSPHPGMIAHKISALPIPEEP